VDPGAEARRYLYDDKQWLGNGSQDSHKHHHQYQQQPRQQQQLQHQRQQYGGYSGRESGGGGGGGGSSRSYLGDEGAAASSRYFEQVSVGLCRLTVSESVLKAPIVSALETIIS